MHQRVVLATGEDELRDRLLEALGPYSAEAVEVPSVRRALELSAQIPIHLLVVRYPIDGMSFAEFLRAFREAGCASRGAQVVALAPGRSIGGLKRSAGAGVALLRSDIEIDELTEIFKTFLRRSPRFSGNLLVGADLELPTGKVRKMLQVENISETGMLLRTKVPIAEGTRLAFELQVPQLKAPIEGTAEVVRQVLDPGGGRARGIGVRITSFRGDSRSRLTKFLKIRRLPPAMSK